MLIHQAIIDFIKEKTGMDSVILESHILSQVKSFDFMVLILELEQKFSLKLPIEQAVANDIVTINQFVNWVKQQRD
jgi:acyl carrier protein